MQYCCGTLVYTVIIDIWMVVENVMTLGIAEKFLIYVAIYIFFFYPSNLLIFLLNNVNYTIV